LDSTRHNHYLLLVPRALILLSTIAVALSSALAADLEEIGSNTTGSSVHSSNRVSPEPVRSLIVRDTPNDNGGSVELRWEPSVTEESGSVSFYEISRWTVADFGAEPEMSDRVPVGSQMLTDNDAKTGIDYWYGIVAVVHDSSGPGPGTMLRSDRVVAGPVHSSAQWFNTSRSVVVVFVITLAALILWYTRQAGRGREVFIRKIPGLEAVDEAVGRATEMGRKMFYIPGTQDMENIQTVAGVTILGRVAKLAAEYETTLEVPVSRSLVLVTSREIVKEAYINAGRPDAFNPDSVQYLTDDQFGFAAALSGKIVREKPATVFMLGLFYAESLILAEAGNSVGAIQIAGTAEPSQLPFFVAACDYTLIGEELFAASAYLSREPKLLGSLKGQDIGKAVVLVVILIGVVIQTLGIYDIAALLSVSAD
jgi:hypothetical protein